MGLMGFYILTQEELEKNPPIVDEHPEWSPTRLDLAEFCMKAYWFNYIVKMYHKINASIAVGKRLHKKIEGFWKIDPKSGLLIPSRKSPEAFANSSVGDWKRIEAKTGISDGQEIEWDYPKQKWTECP